MMTMVPEERALVLKRAVEWMELAVLQMMMLRCQRIHLGYLARRSFYQLGG
jgi:hypothetical protein